MFQRGHHLNKVPIPSPAFLLFVMHLLNQCQCITAAFFNICSPADEPNVLWRKEEHVDVFAFDREEIYRELEAKWQKRMHSPEECQSTLAGLNPVSNSSPAISPLISTPNIPLPVFSSAPNLLPLCSTHQFDFCWPIFLYFGRSFI